MKRILKHLSLILYIEHSSIQSLPLLPFELLELLADLSESHGGVGEDLILRDLLLYQLGEYDLK